MTVAELIAKLSEVEDLNLPVVILDHCGNGQGFAENIKVISIIPEEGHYFDALEISVGED